MSSPHGVRRWNLSGSPLLPDMLLRLVDADAVWEVAEAAVEMYIFARRYDILLLERDAVGRLGWCWDVARDLRVQGKKLYMDDGLRDEFELEGDGLATFVSAETIRRAYEFTEKGSAVRGWLVGGLEEFFCFGRENIGMLPRQYLVDVSEDYGLLRDDRSEGGKIEDECW